MGRTLGIVYQFTSLPTQYSTVTCTPCFRVLLVDKFTICLPVRLSQYDHWSGDRGKQLGGRAHFSNHRWKCWGIDDHKKWKKQLNNELYSNNRLGIDFQLNCWSMSGAGVSHWMGFVACLPTGTGCTLPGGTNSTRPF